MSPGGADSVAIIAASSQKVDVSFIMALQVSRFLVILAFRADDRQVRRPLGRTRRSRQRPRPDRQRRLMCVVGSWPSKTEDQARPCSTPRGGGGNGWAAIKARIAIWSTSG